MIKRILSVLSIVAILAAVGYGLYQMGQIWIAVGVLILVNEIQLRFAIGHLQKQLAKSHTNLAENQQKTYGEIRNVLSFLRRGR